MKRAPKLKKKAKVSKDDINYKKLFFELMIVLTVIFVAVCAILYPALKYAGAFGDDKDFYAPYREILDTVDTYDYSKGRDLELEKTLNDVYYNGEDGARVFAYGMARGTYFCNLGYFNTANATFEYLDTVASPNPEESVEMEARKVVCERKQDNEV